MTSNPSRMALPEALVRDDRPCLTSEHFDDLAPVFSGEWFSDLPIPRFGEEVWEVVGLARSPRRTTWPIDFTELSPEWSLIAREAIFAAINRREHRHLYSYNGTQNLKTIGGATIVRYRVGLGILARFADLTGAGLPSRWERLHVEDFQDLALTGEYGSPHDVSRALLLLNNASQALTLGGPRFDTLLGETTHAWAGAERTSSGLMSVGLAPEIFRQVVCDALFYIEKASDDIFAAKEWWDGREQFATTKVPRVVFNSDAYPNYPDDVGEERSRRIHDAIQDLGGIPTPTISVQKGSQPQPGEPDRHTLFALAGLARRARAEAIASGIIDSRLAQGAELVPGGIPVPISNHMRPDGTYGPWRESFCALSIDRELQTLANAAIIVIAAFTAMRESEISNIPRVGWRTTWHGQDAVVSALVKTADGEPRKWWATPPVVRACEVLERIVHPSSPFLAMIGESARAGQGSDRNQNKAWVAIQMFVWRINRDPNLYGFLPIDAGFKRWGQEDIDDSLPNIHTRSFRFTLASISNFVALGDVAFQQQAKHAQIAMTHSYSANSATSEWHDVLNVRVNADAIERTEKTVDLYAAVWSGERELAGHAGRDLTRTVRQLLEGLDIEPPDEDDEADVIEQFQVRVLESPELAAAIRSTATLLTPGTVNHCLKNVVKAMCVEHGLEPTLGLCRPEICGNVLLDSDQQPFFQHRRDQVVEWLGIPRLPSAQREVLEQRERRLSQQLRTEPADGE